MPSLRQHFESCPHVDIVSNVLGAQVRRLPNYVSAEDIDAVVWAAYDRFMRDEAPNLRPDEVRSHLYVCVHRELIDELRRMDWVPHQDRCLVRKIKTAERKLVTELGEDPPLSAVARSIGVGELKARRALETVAAASRAAGLGALDAMGSIGVGDPAGDQEHLNDFDIPETLLDAVDSLRPLERHVIKRTFMEGAELPEIASEIGRTSCRVAQIRDKALAKLRRNAAVMEMAPTG